MSDPTTTNPENQNLGNWEELGKEEQPKKKLTLKERMALKKNQGATPQEFKPTVKEEEPVQNFPVYEDNNDFSYDMNDDFAVFQVNEKKEKPKKPKVVQEPKVKKPRKEKNPEDEQKKIPKEMILSADVDNLEIDTKTYQVVDLKKDPMNIVFIGHVDSGKSTICGNILVRSGKVDPSDLRKFEMEAKENNRESWFMAYILDIDDSERQKGKTVEVGRATFDLSSKRFTILDAPGHKNYVPNMIDGAAQADIACLVISSKTGEYESGFEKGGQTQEHAILAKAFNVSKIIVIVNKMDTDNWSLERFNMIQDQIGGFLINQVGYTKDQIEWVPISGLTGENIDKPVEKSKAPWYNGNCLFEALDKSPVPERFSDQNLRIPVLDRMKDQILYIYGKIESGIIKEGQKCTLMPTKKVMKIKSILNNDDERILFAKVGENVKIGIKGLEEDDIKRGYMICNNDDYCYNSMEFEANLTLVDFNEKSLLSTGFACILHMHTAVEDISITNVVGFYDTENGGKLVKCQFLKNGQSGVVRIKSEGLMCMEKYATNATIGSFTLRDQGMTIGYGQITKIKSDQKPKPVVAGEEKKESPAKENQEKSQN